MTKSNRGFFSNQGNITQRYDQIWPVFFNLFEISSMPTLYTLYASFRKFPSKLNELCLWQSQTGFFSSQGDATQNVMIISDQFSNSSKNSSMSTLTASFWKSQSKLTELCWWQSQTEVFQQSSGCNSKIYDLIWLFFKLVWDFIHVHLICKFQEDLIKTEWVSLMTKSEAFFSKSRGHNSKINDLIWPVFKLVQDFIHVHRICKFQEAFIKTDWVTLMTKSNGGFFNN